MAEAKAEPSSAAGAETSRASSERVGGAPEAEEGPSERESEEADLGWPGPIDEPPPLLAA